MKLFGSLSRLVSILFRQDGQDITVRPNQSTTYSAARDIQLPQGDAAHVLVSRNSTDTLTNKSIDADFNNITNIVNDDIRSDAGIVYSKLSIADGDLTAAKTSGLPAVITNVSNLVTLSGVAADSANLGLFSGSIIPDNQTIKASIQSLETYVDALADPFFYAGTYNANTNSPALANTDTGKNGYVYYISVAGSQDFGAGSISFEVGDKVANNGTTWDKWDMTDAVTSVNSQTGAVVLNTSHIAENTNLYYTDSRARAAISATDSSSVDFTYNSVTGALTGSVIPGGVDHDALLNFAANEHIDHTSVSINTLTDSGLSGGGDISASRSLVIDPSNAPTEASLASGDFVLIRDVSASALKKVTVQQIADLAAGSAAQSFTWVDGSATKACTHTFSTNAVLVEIYDENMETVWVNTVDRTSTSVVTLTRSEATAGGDWTVVIRN